MADVSGALGADATRGAAVYGVFLDAGGGLLLDGAVASSVNSESGRVRGLDAGAVLAFSNVNGAGGVVVVVLVYLDAGLGELGSRGTEERQVLEGEGMSQWTDEEGV